MTSTSIDISEFHWLMGMIQTIDVGLIVLDREYNIQIWNSFMENHSGVLPNEAINANIFELFDDIPRNWFQRKVESVFTLKNRAFTVWEQRQYLFKFKNYRPVTGMADFMFQNITLIPLSSADGVVNHVGIIIYDVTDIATSKLQLQDANGQLEVLSRTDRLTELFNRGFWEESLTQEFVRIKRTGEPCSLVMFDIDHFKKVNDNYGHQAGDEVIRATSQALRDCKRASDIAGRYGGEEFGVILIGSDAENSLTFTERLRETIEAMTIVHGDAKIRFTISLGIAGLNGDMKDYKQWIEASDKALYHAKETGRNRSVVYTSAMQALEPA